jgi:beta-glucosidase
VDVTNEGSVDADEVVQLYVRDLVSTVVTPDRSLAAFCRRHIPAGKTETVTLTVGERALRLLDKKMEWVVEPGAFELMIGASSTDIRQIVRIDVD